MEVIASDFDLEWKYKDGEIHKADYDDLIKAYEKQEEHNKEVRAKAIDCVVNKALEQLTVLEIEDSYATVTECKMILKNVAEQLKGVADER